jgi:hypothetical protein
MDGCEDGIELLEYFVIPKAENREALILEELCPFQILFVSSRMLASVELDNKAMFHATEIRDKRRNRMLPAEFSPCALPST